MCNGKERPRTSRVIVRRARGRRDLERLGDSQCRIDLETARPGRTAAWKKKWTAPGRESRWESRVMGQAV